MADFRNTKEGRNVAQKYADILHLSRPEPPVKYPRMALSNRAKIFSPFAALRGFDDEISSEGASKLLVKKVELSDEEKNTLSDKLLQVKKGMKVVVRYFVRSTESTGKYISNSVILTSYSDLSFFGQITSRRSPAPSITKQFRHKITYPLSYNGLRRLGDLGIVNINFTIPTCGL